MSINESGRSASLPISIGTSSALTRRPSQPIPIHPVPVKDSVAISDPVKSYLKYGRHGDSAVAQQRVLAVQHRVANHYGTIEEETRNKLAQAAIDNEEVGLIQALGQAGYNFNVGNETLGENDTPLTYAISENKPKAVRALLAAGADVNAIPSMIRISPVQIAIYGAEKDKNYDVLQAVLEAQPTLNEDQTERLQALLVAKDNKLKKLLGDSVLKAHRDDNDSLITYLLDVVKLKIPFTYLVVKFASEMTQASDESQKATALANFLSGKYIAPKPSAVKDLAKQDDKSKPEDELQFEME